MKIQTMMKRNIQHILFTLLLLVAGMEAWGQTDYSGTYYIKTSGKLGDKQPAGNYYLCPTEGWCYYKATNDFSSEDTGMPFLTSYQCRNSVYGYDDATEKAVWKVEKHPTEDYYYIKRASDGKYVVLSGQIRTTTNANRMRLHLEALTNPDDNALFAFSEYSDGLKIKPKTLTTYLTVNGSNFNTLTGEKGKGDGPTGYTNTAGIIGIFNTLDDNSKFYLESTVYIVPPTITHNNNNTFTISAAEGTIYYTTDGSDPTTSSTEYTGAIPLTDGMTAIKAIAVVDDNSSGVRSMPLHTYTYYIVNKTRDIAIKKEIKQGEGKSLSSIDDIPADIRSSYLADESVSFYSFSGAYSVDKLDDENKITATPSDKTNIYVTYTTDHLSEKFLHLRGARAFNIKTDDGFIYDDNGIAYEETPSSSNNRLWYISGGDPYNVQIKNVSTDKYLVFSTAPTLSLAATATTKFILMEGTAAGDGTTYEQVNLMAATDIRANDFSKAEVKVYPVDISVTYKLIDRQKKLIATIESNESELKLPDEWISPLVSAYHFYKTASIVGDVYTLSNEIHSTFDVESGDPIYVNYDVSDDVDLDGMNSLNIEGKENKTYMLRFLNGIDFNQENGSDGIAEEATKAVYPYNNGDVTLYVYGADQWQTQLSKGASTRSRWLWYIVPANDPASKDELDPYHVNIVSYQDHIFKDKDGNELGRYHSYLRTYKPEGYANVVTSVINSNPLTNGGNYGDDPYTDLATEYMIVGTAHQTRLVTLNPIDDGTSNERRTVNSFEQYWKNRPTVQGILSEANKVTTEGRNVTLTSAQKTEIAEEGWHVYTAWAYSAPWINNKSGTTETNKQYLNEEHAFQTISMGSGNFVFEEVSLEPLVILIDNHGWEVMRVPLSKTDVLRTYNSPMVEQYKWYSASVKTTGYHKYSVIGTPYHTSTSLATVPTGAKAGNDFYVAYTVKPAYTSTYTGAATAAATKPTAFLLKQGGKYAKTSGLNIEGTDAPASIEDAPDDMLWFLKPNFDIDREMGYLYEGETGAHDEAKTKDATEQDYYLAGKNGFDPYNVQIQNREYDKRYFTTNSSAIALRSGVWTATSSQLSLQNLSVKQHATGHDQTTLNITNATFMVVSDANGNMRLMPRFDNKMVATSDGDGNPFAALAAQHDAADPGDNGTDTQTLWLEHKDAATEIHNRSEITDMNGHYVLASDFTFDGDPLGTSEAPFTGVIDGQYNTYSGLSTPLVAYANGAVIRNLILDNVTINSGNENGNVGAICNEATGATRIYNCGILATESTVRTDENGYTHITNCSSSISGSNYVGSIVGLLDGSSRVINCYSYADITGGAEVGGIVGHNNVETSSSYLETMVMNCMYYGNIKNATNKAPIYNGENIVNKDATGVGNYNYFYAEAPYVVAKEMDKSNGALMAETRFLQRFEFFRNLQNSHRELAAWWATGDRARKDEMAKWVLLPSQIGSSTPYPVLAKPGYYPSVVNIDAENATTTTERNKGGKMGTLTVNIQMGNGAQFAKPDGAEIVYPSLTLNITDKDPEHFNFNYYKVQLPYYNEVGTKNYTHNRVVTGWKIVSITGGTPGSFTTGTDAPAYNFADRNCTNKDKYSVSGRVFSQGAYWDVPEGVTAITIEPYWAKAVYLADANADVVYDTNMGTAQQVPNVGGGNIYTNGSQYSIAGNNQVVYTSLDNATANTALNPNTSHTVNDYAVVLVGNYHHVVSNNSGVSGSKPYTVTSIDLDGDNEPDFSLMLRNNGRNQWHPVKWDFINIPGLGMAQKSTGGEGSYNLGIIQPKGWFESTNTSLFRVTQFEYEKSNVHGAAPYILQGGVMEQWVTGQNDGDTDPKNTTYFHVGGNVWFKEFHRGTHQDNTGNTNHTPISVTGGDFDKFYLTGMYRADVTSYADNAECYINGGRFGIVAGAAMEGIGTSGGGDNTGNVTWQIQNADIKEFYGGGFNADSNHRVEGNITTTITGGKIDLFCGGPKFGDMNEGKTVTTTATGCEFGTFFGAGFGGSSYSRRAPSNMSSIVNIDWNKWVKDEYKQAASGESFPGISTQFSYQFIPYSDNVKNVARLFVEHVLFSLATTRSVTSTLTGCTVTGNFYGGGSLGMVAGPATSTLTDCTVKGNVFGAGYSASLPTVEVDSVGFRTEPLYYEQYGTYRTGVKGQTTTYTWEHGNSISIDKTNHILYTTEVLEGLGSVTGDATLTLNNTTVGSDADETLDQGNVFGGGEESSVNGNTTVTINGGNIYGSVFGGGDIGSVGTFTPDGEGKPASCAENTGKCTVTVTGAANIGHDNMQMPQDWGHVFGAGRGTISAEDAEKVGGEVDHVAYVDTTEVTIGVLDAAIDASPLIKGSVYGGSENGHVLHGTKVVINSGQIGVGNGIGRRYTAEEWGSGNQLAPCASWDYVENGDVYDPYTPEGGWDDEHKDLRPSSKIATDGHTYYGNVFGGGSGVIPSAAGEWNRNSGQVEGSTQVVINGGHILTSVYGGNEQTDVLGETSVEMNGGTVGVPRDSTAIMANPAICFVFGAGKGDKRTAFNTWTNVAKSNVTIKGGTIYGSVYGGGEDGHVLGDAVTLISKETGEGKIAPVIGCDGKSGYDGNVFGGGQGSVTALTAGVVGGNVKLNIQDGTMKGSVYGGGRLASVGTHFEAPENANYGKLNDDGGVGKHGNISVNLTGGTIYRNVFGGGMGTQAEVENKDRLGISRNVWLNLNKDVETTGVKGCVVKGNIFGCNNMNASPKGTVDVHIYATQNDVATQIQNDGEVTNAKVLNRYDVKAVYGGGNMAAYVPDTLETASTNVIIDGCDRTSIKQVYGGGNAASTPGTSVTVNGTYEIEEVFGGGNGKDAITINGVTKDNPGANVGFYDYSAVEDQYPTKEDRETDEFVNTYVYGTGAASVNIYGGKIHRVFGGSNTKGNVKSTAITLLDESSGCDFCVDEAYGGGKSAPMDAEARLLMACIPGLQAVYGGAEAADVHGDVTLNITNGTFKRVFGGNNKSGTISGAIKVNIEEVGCRPIIIGELYGGGNLAAYSVKGYNDDGTIKEEGDDIYADPQVNLKAFTSIGSVYGGGYGASAIMVGSPTVNINEVVGDPHKIVEEVKVDTYPAEGYHDASTGGDYTATGFGGAENVEVDDDHYVDIPAHVKGKIGAIGKVFGGGNAAQVKGSTTVNIGNLSTIDFESTGAGEKTPRTGVTVVGADIKGNVYGGGDAAEVTGNASVNIGKKVEATSEP